jgi:hypothetical protein
MLCSMHRFPSLLCMENCFQVMEGGEQRALKCFYGTLRTLSLQRYMLKGLNHGYQQNHSTHEDDYQITTPTGMGQLLKGLHQNMNMARGK